MDTNDWTWKDYVIQLDRMLEGTRDFKEEVNKIILREFPTFESFSERTKEVWRVVASSFLCEREMIVYDVFLAHHRMMKPEPHVQAAREQSAPWQKRILRTMKVLMEAYPEELQRQKQAHANELNSRVEKEVQKRVDAEAAEEARKEEQLRKDAELEYLRSQYVGENPYAIMPPPSEPIMEELDDIRHGPQFEDVEDEEGENVPRIEYHAPEAVDSARTILFPEPEPFAPEPADSGEESGSDEAESVCITSFFPTIKKKTAMFVELVAGRRSPVKALRARGKTVVEDLEENTVADYYISVPSKGQRTETFLNLTIADRPSHVLLPIAFLCRQEFKDASSKARVSFVYGPTKAHLDLEDGERVTFGPSMWVSITPSVTTMARKASPIRGMAVKAAVAKYEGSDTSTVVAKPAAKSKEPPTMVGNAIRSITDYFVPKPVVASAEVEEPASPPLPEDDAEGWQGDEE